MVPAIQQPNQEQAQQENARDIVGYVVTTDSLDGLPAPRAGIIDIIQRSGVDQFDVSPAQDAVIGDDIPISIFVCHRPRIEGTPAINRKDRITVIAPLLLEYMQLMNIPSLNIDIEI